jgi:glycosyltransferase involved in cell wall biosynthesis
MRILHVNKFLYRRGGAEAYAEDLAQLQHEAGHEVTFFGMRHPRNRTYMYETSFPSEVEFAPLPSGPIGKVRGFGRMMWSTSAEQGIDHVLADFAPDVVHVHNIHNQLSPSVLRPIAKRGIPAVMTLHDYKLACPTYRLLDHGKPCTACVTGGPRQAIVRNCHESLASSAAVAVENMLHRTIRAYTPIHRFLCPSWFLADVMRSAGVYPDRLVVQENFVDTRTVAPAHLPGEGAAYLGPLSHEKGVHVLIRAWEHAPRDAHLHIAGDGPMRAQLEELAAELVPGRVTFHGMLDTTKAHALVRDVAVVVAPSLWHENQPLAVLEAFASARPVIATRMGGLPEIIDEGIDGELVPADDVEALAKAVTELTGDAERAAAMGRNGRAKVERRFAPGAHAQAVEDHYKAVIG